MGCLTRVMIDGGGVEVAQLQAVMQRIQGILPDLPPSQREYLANALLDLALSWIGPVYTVASTCSPRPEDS